MNVVTTKILIEQTGVFSQLVIDHLNVAPVLEPFRAHTPIIDSFDAVIAQRTLPAVQRALLADTLTLQYAEITPVGAVPANIQALRAANTFTVTTGHQLNIFGGPLYFIFKIVSAIKLARTLAERYPENLFVPVFWMASEDHDIEEISTIHLYGKNVKWETDYTGAAGRAGTQTFAHVRQVLTDIMGEAPNAAALNEIFALAYNGKHTLAQATRQLVHALFGDYGLVVVEPDEVKFKEVFAPFAARELKEQLSFRTVSKTSQALATKHKAQVHAREINLFYVNDNVRERIEKNQDGTYSVVNSPIRWRADELQAVLADHPEYFSPNVVLRPLYQEVLLPNVAYIGGGAEVAYWHQYRDMFAEFDVPMPIVLLRNSAMWVDKATQSKAEKTGIALTDYFEDVEVLIKKFIAGLPQSEVSLQDESDQLSTVFETIKEKAMAVDPTLQASVEADLSRALKQVQQIESKLVRAEKRKHETELAQIRAVKEKLFPAGVLQERYDNFIPYFLKHGRSFFEILLQSFDPLGKDFYIFSEA